MRPRGLSAPTLAADRRRGRSKPTPMHQVQRGLFVPLSPSALATATLCPDMTPPSLLAGQYGAQHLLRCAYEHAGLVRIGGKNRRHEVLCLLQGDMRRQGRYFWIGFDLEHHRTIRCNRFFPGTCQPIWVVDENTM